ncbi:ubiquitin carboxyl-terminal hydrolase 30 homolog [Anabrus simplex]|uniref:ubiquitin carboxyl-terminal hydrolase 30 homolog n=1 Tax=Anabrus simplex TaxID=316456 RepID=UPI0035A372C5
MDAEKLCMVASVIIPIVVGAIILWNSSPESKQKRSRINGLLNTGNTCFLNAILQALASCQVVLEWLSQQEEDSFSLATSLYSVLLVVNNQHPTISLNPFAPSEVIDALRYQGWIIDPGENDAHELFNAIMATLEEEMEPVHQKSLSLSDALGQPENAEDSNNYLKFHRSEIQLFKLKYLEQKSTNALIAPREVHSDTTESEKKNSNESNDNISKCLTSHSAEEFTPRTIPDMSPKNFSCSHLRDKDDLGKGDQSSHSQIKSSDRQLYTPFHGYLTSQLQCTVCGHKSAVVYDKFDSLSLPLPGSGDLYAKRPSLLSLLDKFISTELVRNVTCEQCSERDEDRETIKTPALKTMNFGKLPKCLCIHIQRTSWQIGHAYKRDDFVEFPEYLSMQPYTFVEFQRKQSTVGDHKDGEMRMKHLYKLVAVVVHRGDVDSGHFETYRRHPRFEEKWYFTSDAEVRESSLAETMNVCAYLLFYVKIM